MQPHGACLPYQTSADQKFAVADFQTGKETGQVGPATFLPKVTLYINYDLEG